MEETGILVRVGRIAFLREWVVPKYVRSIAPDPDDHRYGYGLEVFYYATPEASIPEPQPEKPGSSVPEWVPLAAVPTLPLWPKELKTLCQRLQQGDAPEGTVSILGRLESPLAVPENDPFT